jgi:glutamyl-tRNA synthetase
MEEMGFIPEAVINWIVLMGWSYDDKTEFFTLDDLTEKFSLEKLNPSPAAINFSKLDHFNGLHIRNLEQADFASRLKPWFEKAGFSPDDDVLLQVASIIQERTKRLNEAVDMAGFFFQDEISLAMDRIITEKLSKSLALSAAQSILSKFKDLQEITQDTAEVPLRELAEDLGLKAGQIFGLIREILTGQRVSPPIFDIIPILGREIVLSRLEAAIKVIEEY